MSPARLLAFAFVGGLALWVVFGQLRATANMTKVSATINQGLVCANKVSSTKPSRAS